jgi:putative ABC transport system substrate-binding protein
MSPSLHVGLLLAMIALATPPFAEAQETRGKPVKIGRLSPLSAETDQPNMEAFRRGLRDLGWREHMDFTIEGRFADGKSERLSGLAADLARQPVDLILVGSTPGALAAKSATSTIPIVMITTGDPVAGRIVASLARPGGNVTGVTGLATALNAKRVELLKEALPGAARIAILGNPKSPYLPAFQPEREPVARALRVSLPVHEAGEPASLERAFAAMAAERVDAFMMLSDVMFFTERRRIVDLAARRRIPAVYPDREFVDAGGLMFYGASLVSMYRHAAVYVDRIMKGARPADLPVEQPTTLELVVNVKAAKAIGLTLPDSVLGRADHVIE